MISWKHSFRRLNEEFEIAKKKKQALDNLLSIGKISQSTYDAFSKEIQEAMEEIEKQQQALQEKMNAKMEELDSQIRTLEMLLANSEIQHVTGEVDDEVYRRQADLLSMGLENSRKELEDVREAAEQLSSCNVLAQQDVGIEPRENVVSKTEVEVVDIPVSTVKDEPPEPPLEPIQADAEDPQEAELETEAEEKQEA